MTCSLRPNPKRFRLCGLVADGDPAYMGGGVGHFLLPAPKRGTEKGVISWDMRSNDIWFSVQIQPARKVAERGRRLMSKGNLLLLLFLLLFLFLLLLFLLLLLLLILLLLKCYSPSWTLVSSTVFLHSWRSLAIACLFYIHITFKSFSNTFLQFMLSLSFPYFSYCSCCNFFLSSSI